jgi:hypothetical protein
MAHDKTLWPIIYVRGYASVFDAGADSGPRIQPLWNN